MMSTGDNDVFAKCKSHQINNFTECKMSACRDLNEDSN